MLCEFHVLEHIYVFLFIVAAIDAPAIDNALDAPAARTGSITDAGSLHPQSLHLQCRTDTELCLQCNDVTKCKWMAHMLCNDDFLNKVSKGGLLAYPFQPYAMCIKLLQKHANWTKKNDDNFNNLEKISLRFLHGKETPLLAGQEKTTFLSL